MKNIVTFLTSFFIIIYCSGQGNWKYGRLKPTHDGHYLQYEDGTPFFWLGDTGWDLFYKLKLSEIKEYLDNRAAKGFNVIQAVALAEPDGIRKPNRYGQLPLINNDPTQPNNQYFSLIDSTIHLAAKHHMFIGLLPTWGDKIAKMWGEGPVIFDSINAYTYGKWIGNRYKNDPNIIWIAGGDRPAFTDSMDWRPVWRAMIKGIREGTDGKAIITYHPAGESSSSQFWNGEDFLDVNMIQSGHRKPDLPTWQWITHDYDLIPPKPVLDGEPNYEDHPINWNPENGYFRDYDVRKQLYRSVFSGACGVTYGHNSIFQFYGHGDKKVNFADRYWEEALNRPGAFQAGYLKKLILSRPSPERVPDQFLIMGGQGKDSAEYATAFRAGDSTYAMIYLPVGKKIEINTSLIKAKLIKAWWFNPRTGKGEKSFSFGPTKSKWFTTPSLGMKDDWVLVLDDAGIYSKNPGSK
ncbi:MAG: glycoside hydrolase family 140 protein [Ginsengibacter sp.]